jgi:hypothetical protein
MDYRISLYDPCVANMMTACGKQLTVIWHVDNLISLCKKYFKLTEFSCYMAKIKEEQLLRSGHGVQ